MAAEVFHLRLDFFLGSVIPQSRSAHGGDDGLDISIIKLIPARGNPFLGFRGFNSIHQLRYFRQMFSRMIEIDNLDRPRKVLLGDSPDPFGPVSQEDDLLRSRDAAPDRLGINSAAEALSRFYSPNIGGGFLVPYRVSLLVHHRLCECTPQLGLPRLGLARSVFSLASFCLPRHYRHPTPVDRHVHVGNRGLAQKGYDFAQQDLFLFPLILLLDLFAYGLCHALDGLRCNQQAGKQFQVLPPVIKSLFSSYLPHHATYTRTEARIDNVQFSILGDDPLSTWVTVVIGSTDIHGSQNRDQSLLPVFDKSSRMTFATTNARALVSPAVGI